jgi:hypothetical protein
MRHLTAPGKFSKTKIFLKVTLSTFIHFSNFEGTNNNQHVDLDHNQIMICVICHNDYIGLKILAMHTRYRKWLITYCKINGIRTMKKHVDDNHFVLVRKLVEDPNITLTKAPLDWEVHKKRAHVYPSTIISYESKFKIDDPTQMGLLENLLLLVVKGLLWKLLSPFGSKGCNTNYVHELSSHQKRLLLNMFYIVWLKKPWLCMCNRHYLIAYQPFAHLICERQKEHMPYSL